MKQLSIFKNKLWDQGYSVNCNWSSTDGAGNKLEHCTISKNGKSIMVVFQVWKGDNRGFDHYIQSQAGNTFSEAGAEIETVLNGGI